MFKFNCSQINQVKKPPLTEGDVVVVCRVRNGFVYLEEFLRHYRNLGVNHFAFIDNGSSDGTTEYLCEAQDISVYRTDLNFRDYKGEMTRFLIDSFSNSNWVLSVDIDEFFDYPFSVKFSLKNLIGYLNRNGYNAVVAQMLDQFPKDNINNSDSNWKNTHAYFDITSAEKNNYVDYYGKNNSISNVNICYYIGGIRNDVFGSRSWMTKHPLIKPGKGVKIEHDHHIKFASVADFSGVLLHYKYAGDFVSYVRDVVARGVMFNDSVHYKKYLQRIESGPQILLYSENAVEYQSAEQLLNLGYLSVSEQFMEEVLSL